MCLYPRLIKNRKYTANKKNGGNIPTITDDRVKLVPVGCEKCIECRKQKARGWQVRLLEDIKTNKNGKFITLTFSNENITKLIEENEFKIEGYELDNTIATRACRLFLERWRKRYKKSLRHWLVTELGHNGTENIHLHGIVWTNKTIEDIRETWNYGYVYPRNKEEEKRNYVNSRTVNYIIKYVHKIDEKHKEYKSKILTSAGIGNNYTKTTQARANSFKSEKETIETYRTEQGYKINMPIYWRNKIYTDEEREKLWLQRLDKNERWICGEKIKADDLKQYEATLKYYRKKNKELGYGTDEKNWDQKQYETERRKLLINKRIAKVKAINKRVSPPAAPRRGAG